MDELIRQARELLAKLLTERQSKTDGLVELRTQLDAEGTTVTEAQVVEAVAARDALDPQIEAAQARLAELEDEKARNEAAAEMARRFAAPGESRSYDGVARIGQEKRTYNPGEDPKGKAFVLDVARQFLFNDFSAAERLGRHMQEERVERGTDQFVRAAGTAAFAGLVVPQYLTDLYAPQAKAGRPFADICRHVDLPETGMTASIGRVTTGTSVDVQTENNAVSETDIDDTLLTVSVQTAAGQQTLSRQAVERGIGVEGQTLDDLYRAYGTKLDSLLLNQATNGLTNVATAIAYTDGTPTAAELYPKLLAAPAAVEAALLDQDPNDTIAVMHSRRWYWIQSQLSSTFPLFGQPGIDPRVAGMVEDGGYGSGFRGVLPSGVPVIVDNNVATNLGAGTNEDEIYFISRSESFLWEDPSAPMLIRAEQTKAASLGVLLVVYGYFAYTFARRSHAQKVNGTGLVTPTF